MASPLLEAGAIDGARGILINISGSSNLRLSEVNAASTLIQNAAHEDANIIFGAVQNEAMGDDIKITVIATGFKQGSAERRDQMLSAALRQAAAPRIESRPAMPRFASEDPEDDAPLAAPIPIAPPVLVPVSAREFVTAFRAEPEPEHEITITEMDPEPQPLEVEPVFEEASVAVAVDPPTVVSNHPAFDEDSGANLDIPAFMRQAGI
jgi:cell division protein FtsZ